MTASADQATRRNLKLTRGVVLLSFCLNAGVNLALIGYFARTGGLGLVGDWAWLNAVLMNVLILDLGLTEALTFRIARDGLTATQPLLRTALRLAAVGVVLSAAASCLCLLIGAPGFAAASLAALAAVLQLASNWRISIRLGQHQQYWYNLKTIARVAAQTGLAVWLIKIMPQSQPLGLALALTAGALIEVSVALWATRTLRLRSGPRANLTVLASAARLFALTNLSHRALQPLSILLLGLTLNTAAVAVFSLALRIPTVISQAVSEALRGLLAGLAQLRDTEPDRIPPLLRDCFTLQLALLGPIMIFATAFAPKLLHLWLGAVPQELVTALRILLLATALTGITTPFHWANYALGPEKLAARAYAIGTCATLAAGGLALVSGHGLLGFVTIFGLIQSSLALAMLAIAQTQNRLVSRSLRELDFQKIVLRLTITAAIAFGAEAAVTALPQSANLLLLALSSALVLALTMISLRMKQITWRQR